MRCSSKPLSKPLMLSAMLPANNWSSGIASSSLTRAKSRIESISCSANYMRESLNAHHCCSRRVHLVKENLAPGLLALAQTLRIAKCQLHGCFSTCASIVSQAAGQRTVLPK